MSRAPAATVIRRNGATTVINPFHAVSRVSASPPGVFKFSRQATYKSMGAIPATVLALYPVKLEDGSPGHLIVVKGEEHGQLWSVVQPDVEEFTLHAGERVISVRYAQYNRILPFNAPAPATGG
ncbi:MAG: hypothetical protein L0I62_04605 [Gammaproteobacteria bacterium]|nr:hypothetical protein [Gammaproteobacteria bacterium]